jgi:hypothetical protein
MQATQLRGFDIFLDLIQFTGRLVKIEREALNRYLAS